MGARAGVLSLSSPLVLAQSLLSDGRGRGPELVFSLSLAHWFLLNPSSLKAEGGGQSWCSLSLAHWFLLNPSFLKAEGGGQSWCSLYLSSPLVLAQSLLSEGRGWGPELVFSLSLAHWFLLNPSFLKAEGGGQSWCSLSLSSPLVLAQSLLSKGREWGPELVFSLSLAHWFLLNPSFLKAEGGGQSWCSLSFSSPLVLPQSLLSDGRGRGPELVFSLSLAHWFLLNPSSLMAEGRGQSWCSLSL